MSIKLGFVATLLSVAILLAPSADADDPDYLTLSAGWFDLNRQKDQGAEFSMEYRSDKKFWWFKPFVHIVDGRPRGIYSSFLLSSCKSIGG